MCIRNSGNVKIPTCIPLCGDGVIVAGKEECDDKNDFLNDGCSDCKIDKLFTCQGQPSVCVDSCGNNKYEPHAGEQCDNGDSTSPDGCSNSCEIIPHWSCPINVEGQASVCQYVPYCGDGLTNQASETCDDANNVDNDGCTNCVIDRLYVCQGSPSQCQWSCGDNVFQPAAGEQCDNGNSTTSDGCSNTCEAVAHWSCSNVDGQRSDCQYVPYCGDGLVNQAS